MGVSTVWVCDRRKEWLDPYPLDEPALFWWCRSGDWYNEQVRLLSDCGGTNDEYYLRTADDEQEANAFGGSMSDVYRDITAQVREFNSRMSR